MRYRAVRRQLDLLAYRIDRHNPGPGRDTLIAKLERLLIQHALLLASRNYNLIRSPPTPEFFLAEVRAACEVAPSDDPRHGATLWLNLRFREPYRS